MVDKIKADKHNELDLSEKPVNEARDKTEGEFLRIVRERAAYARSAWDENFKNAEADVRFLGGEQWPDQTRLEREAEDRPCLTFNDLPQYVDQVLGDQRQNRPGIHISPADGLGTDVKIPNTKGTTTYSMAEVYEGLTRNIEYTSKAEAHYDTAFQHAVEGGFGWLRVYTAYDNHRSFDLSIRIKSVKNRWAVLLDPDAEEPDMSDANYGFVLDDMPRFQYDMNYPDKAIGALTDDAIRWWGDDKTVKVAEYYERYALQRELLLLSNNSVVWLDEVKDVLDDMANPKSPDDQPITIIRRRKCNTYKVRWWKVTANAVLAGPIDIPCSTIPIVPVLGKEVNILGKSDYRGMIRNAKSPKQADNFWMTAATERVALAPKAPYIGTQEAFEGFENVWASANTKNHAYLPYNKGQERPARDAGATMPVAELQMAASMTDKVKSTIGMYSASLGAQSNETSGKAILARQRESDVGAFAFVDNLSRAIERVGIICTEMIPRVYDANRVIRIRHASGKGDFIEINKTIRDEETGKMVVVNDMEMGSFDVIVKTGPSYSTQRAEAAESLMEFIRVVPSMASMVIDKVAESMDWPGADEIAMRLRTMIPANLLTEEERESLGDQPQPEPTPEQAATMAQAEADMAQAKADVAMAEAKSAEAQAKISEIHANANRGEMEEFVRDIVAEAMADVIAAAQGGSTNAQRTGPNQGIQTGRGGNPGGGARL